MQEDLCLSVRKIFHWEVKNNPELFYSVKKHAGN